jgi:alkylhydroperoxidase family enzyme
VQAVLDDWRTAPVPRGLRATLGFLERMTLRPDELGADDAETVRAAGIAEDAFVDAVYICALFNMIVRLADALDFEVPTWEELLAAAGARIGRGYELLTAAASRSE